MAKITNEEEYQAALILAAPFFMSAPQPGSPEATRFVSLLAEINAYDMAAPAPEEEAAVQFVISGIKCDACEYRDDDVQLEQYPDYVNKPCPECGANLLTEADFKTVQLMIGMSEVLNAVAAADLIPGARDGDMVEVDLPISMDGSGQIKLTDR